MARQAQHAASIQQPSSIYPRAARSVRGERVVCALGFSYRTRRCRSHRALSLGPPSSQGRASAGQPSIAREAWRPLPCPALPCPACSPPAGRLPHPCASRARWPWGGERVSQQNRAEGREGARVERERTEEASFRPAARLPARRKQHHLPACLPANSRARSVSERVPAPARRPTVVDSSTRPPLVSSRPVVRAALRERRARARATARARNGASAATARLPHTAYSLSTNGGCRPSTACVRYD